MYSIRVDLVPEKSLDALRISTPFKETSPPKAAFGSRICERIYGRKEKMKGKDKFIL